MRFWPCRFKGMIRPNMALGYSDSRKIADRKTVHMALYLRERQLGDMRFKAMHRRWHLEAMERYQPYGSKMKRKEA